MLSKAGYWICALLFASGAGISAAENPSTNRVPDEPEIRNLLEARIKALGGKEGNVGIVIGVISPSGQHIISAGRRSSDDLRPPNADTVFEIGSVTKTFTALLLAEMAEQHEVALDDPVVKYLPAGLRIPERNGKTILLLDLATHTSGLPFMPNESASPNESATTKYSVTDLRHFMASSELHSEIGKKWEYSNIGYWLLGEALADRAGVDYETLLRRRVIAPLGLTNTDFELSSKMKTNFAAGHNAVLQPSPPISTLPIYSLMPAAGGLYSTANDLLKVLAVAMNYERSSLDRAMRPHLEHAPANIGRPIRAGAWMDNYSRAERRTDGARRWNIRLREFDRMGSGQAGGSCRVIESSRKCRRYLASFVATELSA
jgi:D-alanyl-D-alanine-carboxypeptidase/D-alanyl-D-alanine-endopeptidase